jgi:hypothetical protein
LCVKVILPPDQLFDMIRCDIRKSVEPSLTAMMNAELAHFLGREWYKGADKSSLVKINEIKAFPAFTGWFDSPAEQS